MNDSDNDVIKECLSGNARAFEALVEKYHRVIFNMAYRMTRDHDAAEDVVQSAFVKAYENLGRFDPRHRFFSWLYRIAVNEALNTISRARSMEQLDPAQISSEKGPEEVYDQSELSRQIDAALAELDLDHRLVIVLRHFSGCSYREMAEILGIPEKKVKSRLFEGRQHLKKAFKRNGMWEDESGRVH